MWNKTPHLCRYWMRRISEHIALLVLTIMLAAVAPSTCLAQVTVTAGKDISPQQLSVARDTVNMLQSDMEKNFSMFLSGDVVIELRSGKNPDTKKTNGTAHKGHISIWLDSDAQAYKVAFLVAHELTHQYQMEIVGERTLDKNMWFTEGMADVIGASTANYYGKNNFKAFAQSARQKVKGKYIPLAFYERRATWYDAYERGIPVYAKADAAMMYLTSRHSPMLMWSYLYKLKELNDTNAALQRTYGIGTEELEKIIG